MNKNYFVEPLAFGFRPANNLRDVEKPGDRTYIRIRYSVIEKLSLTETAKGFSVLYEAFYPFDEEVGASARANFDKEWNPLHAGYAEVMLTYLARRVPGK